MREPFLTSRVNVILFREKYGNTPWTGVELSAIQDSCLKTRYQSLVFAQLDKDDQKPLWLPDTHIRCVLGDFTLDQLVGAIKLRVQERGGQVVKASPLELANPPDKAQRPDAISQKLEPKERTRASALVAPWTEADRDRFWAAFPNKVGKAEAMKALSKASHKVMPDELFSALTRYANKSDDRPFCNPATWLNQERWLDQPAINNNGQRSYGPPRRHSGADFLAGMSELAADIAGNDQARGHGDEDIPVGRFNIDG
jgi:hypothetical protein